MIDEDVKLLNTIPIGKYLQLDKGGKRWSIAQYRYLLSKHHGIENPTMEQTLQFIKDKAYEFQPHRKIWDDIISAVKEI